MRQGKRSPNQKSRPKYAIATSPTPKTSQKLVPYRLSSNSRLNPTQDKASNTQPKGEGVEEDAETVGGRDAVRWIEESSCPFSGESFPRRRRPNCRSRNL